MNEEHLFKDFDFNLVVTTSLFNDYQKIIFFSATC